MKTKFLYLLIIVFAVSLTSCKKRKAEKGLIGTWDVWVGNYTRASEVPRPNEIKGLFNLDKKGDGYLTLWDKNSESVLDIEIRDLDITDHSSNWWKYLAPNHEYKGDFKTKNYESATFKLLGAGECPEGCDKVTKKSNLLSLSITLTKENDTPEYLKIHLYK